MISLYRNEVKHLTNRVSGALYKGYESCEEAGCTYIVAHSLGIVHSIQSKYMMET